MTLTLNQCKQPYMFRNLIVLELILALQIWSQICIISVLQPFLSEFFKLNTFTKIFRKPEKPSLYKFLDNILKAKVGNTGL